MELRTNRVQIKRSRPVNANEFLVLPIRRSFVKVNTPLHGFYRGRLVSSFTYFTNNTNEYYITVTMNGYHQQLMYTGCISDTFKYIKLARVHVRRTSEILLAISSDHNILKISNQVQ